MQTNSIKRGALIVLEGCDRVGKTTQSKLLAKALSELDFPAQHFPFPGMYSILSYIYMHVFASGN